MFSGGIASQHWAETGQYTQSLESTSRSVTLKFSQNTVQSVSAMFQLGFFNRVAGDWDDVFA